MPSSKTLINMMSANYINTLFVCLQSQVFLESSDFYAPFCTSKLIPIFGKFLFACKCAMFIALFASGQYFQMLESWIIWNFTVFTRTRELNPSGRDCSQKLGVARAMEPFIIFLAIHSPSIPSSAFFSSTALLYYFFIELAIIQLDILTFLAPRAHRATESLSPSILSLALYLFIPDNFTSLPSPIRTALMSIPCQCVIVKFCRTFRLPTSLRFTTP